MNDIDSLIQVLSGIVTVFLIIVFIIIAVDINKIKKTINRFEPTYIAWAKKEGIILIKVCEHCKKKYTYTCDQEQKGLHCPFCGLLVGVPKGMIKLKEIATGDTFTIDENEWKSKEKAWKHKYEVIDF